MRYWKKFWEKCTNWELWPFALIYAPLFPIWFFYAFKAKSLWFFTTTDPTLTFGGFEGEGKKEMYDQLPDGTFPKTVYVDLETDFEVIKAELLKEGIVYPMCVKPESGLKGLLFRKIDNEDKLRLYHQKVPVRYIIQELVVSPLEVSVFYYRYPHEEKGTISGFIQKELMQVVGDGRSTLWSLILQHPKARYRLEEMRIKHEENIETVLPSGVSYPLTHAANLNRGARFTNLQHLIDDRLREVFDPLSHRCSFYYGRYDIKCNSIDDLKKGHFSILEFNGTGAEPNHVYNAGYTWFGALRVFAHHWKVMYQIGKYNHQVKGVPHWGNWEGFQFLRQARRYAAQLEKADREILL